MKFALEPYEVLSVDTMSTMYYQSPDVRHHATGTVDNPEETEMGDQETKPEDAEDLTLGTARLTPYKSSFYPRDSKEVFSYL